MKMRGFKRLKSQIKSPQGGDENDSFTTTVTAKPSEPIRENPLLAKIEESKTAIRELTDQVASLVQTVQGGRQNSGVNQTKAPANTFKKPKRQCVACQKDEKDCHHCFWCGSDTHWPKGCRVGGRQKLSENSQRS